MSEGPVYFETLSLRCFVAAWFGNGAVRRALRGQARVVYYVDASRNGERMLLPFLRRAGVRASRMQFQMRHIKDERGELIRLRLFRQDLFDAQSAILASDTYRTLAQGGWQIDRIKDYVDKGMVYAQIMDPGSPARAIYLIEVVKHHIDQTKAPHNLFVMRARPWFDVYRRYASRFGIDLAAVEMPGTRWPSKLGLQMVLYRFPRLYTLLRSAKENGGIKLLQRGADSRPKLFVDGRGDVNLTNDGHHSDFFWQLTSAFPARDIVYSHRSEKEKEGLAAHGITLVNGRVSLSAGPPTIKRYPRYPGGGGFGREYRLIKSIVASYYSIRAYWRSVFRTNNVKLWMTWYKYDNYHIAATDAIADNGGISLCLPVAFDGFRTMDCMSNTNVLFSHSRFAADIARQCGSVWDYNVITGYSRDYAGPFLRQEALRLRQQLRSHGAERIVFVIDENSLDDARWHTGHSLQRENYSFILQKVLDTPWLGVIFKPKAARTLRRRLSEVAELLRMAEETGRCFVYETSGRHTTSAPPLLAGLSADVCIHGHLCAGTAALECALEGLPTLLIDREGTPDSKLYDLPVGKVVFKSWPEAIDAVMEYFQSPNGVPGFGDWSSVIAEFDPFRDGLAADRIGRYLQWLLEGFQQGKERGVVMAEAAERYRREWGVDKVLSA